MYANNDSKIHSNTNREFIDPSLNESIYYIYLINGMISLQFNHTFPSLVIKAEQIKSNQTKLNQT
ncbi:hypothetical protein BLOT_010111 [Blomia tropicalis]|nr:hypothetical protein BLOT_010111 [Blomia tropicalis]